MSELSEELLLGVALRGVAERYALAADIGDGDLFAAQFTQDGVLESPRGLFKGHASLVTVPNLLRERYAETFHAVHNQVVHPAGEGTRAITYCIARHFWRGEVDDLLCYEMTIRYLDQFAREMGQWRLSQRKLIVLGTRTFPMEAAASFAPQG
ncbi:nuclear transport factor 2 family protein [Microvirga puerhi]|uniref:Nuclear transport factor 2 family protein n=1 Tax=Microvirga puerhi TaxID=2876078 RepID=A0ABS7VVY7_9HYPH|nr:nuclear transport factor 2 family protein [Microvirga puerhi]MBZ6079077.1 nuclear transport factor 2 family protein [Microvirga puerhi]